MNALEAVVANAAEREHGMLARLTAQGAITEFLLAKLFVDGSLQNPTGGP
jgi:hypothetical protein